MKEYYPILKQTPLFTDISDDDLSAMLTCLSPTVTTPHKGEFVLIAGEKVNFVGIVLSGQLQIIREDLEGTRTIVSGLQAGDLFAETFACAGVEKSPVTVEALTPCTILKLQFQKIIYSCSSACVFHSKLIENMLFTIAQKNLFLNNHLQVLSARTTRDKLLTYLKQQAWQSTSRFITIPFSRDQLADFLCVNRSALSREISNLSKEGVLNYHKNTFKLLY